MGFINVHVNNDLDKEFRLEVIKRIGNRKGALGEAVEEALRCWINQKEVK